MSWTELLVQPHQRHLKWRALDGLEALLMILGGIAIAGFVILVLIDVITRQLGVPVLILREIAVDFFVWGIFIGSAAATRRSEHLYLVEFAKGRSGMLRSILETFTTGIVLVVSLAVLWFGIDGARRGLTSYRMPSMMPMTLLYAAIPVFGLLAAVFSVERLVNGWRHGFAGEPVEPSLESSEGARDL